MNNQEILDKNDELVKQNPASTHKSVCFVNDTVLTADLEYRSLSDVREIEALKIENKTQQSYIDNALDNSKETLIGRIAELEKRTEGTVESFNLEAHNLDQQAAALNEYAYSGKPLTKRGLNLESIALSDKAKEIVQ